MRDKFTGGDQKYLRDDQYRDPTKLAARADLHTKYGIAKMRWFPWVAGQIDWPSNGDILEVGCGPGWMWEEAVSQLPSELRITLTDLSAGMVDVALDRASRVFETVQGCEVDAQQLPFKPDSFDVVVANHMLYHVPEPSRAVREFARVLRPHGVLVAGTVGEGNLRELWQIRSEVFGKEHVHRTVRAFGAVTGLPIVQKWFSVVEWRSYEDHLHCTNPDDVLAFMRSTPPAEDASPQQLQNLWDAIRRRFEAGGGSFDIAKTVGAFIGHGPLHRLSNTSPACLWQ